MVQTKDTLGKMPSETTDQLFHFAFYSLGGQLLLLLLLLHERSLNLLSSVELICKIQISNKLYAKKDSTRGSCRDLPLPVC